MNNQFLQSFLRVAADYNNAGGVANTAAQIQYAASAEHAHVIGGIAWSYDVGPVAGGVEIYDGDGTDATTLIFSLDITSDGVGFPICFDPHLRGTAGRALTIKLLAAGAAKGKINVLGHYVQG